MAFGLGAGPCFYYVTLEDASPTRWFNGRTARLEENFSELTGTALELRTFENGDERGLGGGAGRGRYRHAGPPADRPLLPRPLRQLGPLPGPRGRPRRLRRGGCAPLRHRVRGAPADLAREPRSGAAQRPSRLSRSSGHMFMTTDAIDPARLREAIPAAIERAARAMTEPEFREFSGLDAVHRLAAEAGLLARGRRGLAVVRALRLPGDRAPGDGRRLLPPDVLAVPRGGRAPGGAAGGRRGGERWTELAEAFLAASEAELPEPDLWAEIDARAQDVSEAEDLLWTNARRFLSRNNAVQGVFQGTTRR